MQSSPSTAKGSVLVFTLIVLSILLVSSLSVATVALTESRSTAALNRSSVAFQAADAGMEVILQDIYSGACDGRALSCLGTCSGGRISGTVGDATYQASFFDVDDDRITNCSSTSWRSDLETLLTEGRFGNTTRAVQVEILHN